MDFAGVPRDGMALSYPSSVEDWLKPKARNPLSKDTGMHVILLLHVKLPCYDIVTQALI